jgi:uncharacterized protein (DUF169 family)
MPVGYGAPGVRVKSAQNEREIRLALRTAKVEKMIEEIKRIDRKKLFEEKPKNKISIMDKILKILGYGKKG